MRSYAITLALAVFGAGMTSTGGELMVKRGSNDDPHPGPVGERPYEMVARSEPRVPLATFADCSTWTVETRDTEAQLYRTSEQKLYRDTCGKLVYRATGPRPEITLRPAAPVPLVAAWDCVEFWNWGNVWSWAPRQDTPVLSASALFVDANGEEHVVGLGSMPYEYWFLMHRKVAATITEPAYFSGIRFTNGGNREDRTIYLGPVYAYQETLSPLSFEPRPETLPFPTRPDTILPTNSTANYRIQVTSDDDATLMAYLGDDTELAYRIGPAKPFLDGIEILWGETCYQPFGGAFLTLADGGRADMALTGTTRDGEALSLEWTCSSPGVSTRLRATFRSRQKSLVIDFAEDATDGAGQIAGIDLGAARGLHQPRLFWVPYLSYGGRDQDPRILLSAEGLFMFSQFDWFASQASRLFGKHGITASSGTESAAAVFNGGATYTPKTDGRRNPFRERLFLNVSPDVHDVLPTVPNPPSPMREAQCRRQWRVKSGANHAAEVAEAQRLRALGLDQVTIRYHEDSWRDAGESFTFRTQAAPGRGGNPALKRFVADVQHLGWRVGLYTNYTDYAPVNALWNPDWVTRTPDGDWLRAWTRCYAPKPMISVQMEALLAPQIQAAFGENHSYCDVHTAVTPFDRVDYDARVPGAGTFRQTFECFGRLLHNEKTAHQGPVYSEGLNHWWYAGLTDGNYAQMNTARPPEEPLFPDFDLLKLHPLEMDAGMGSPGMFYRASSLHDYRQFIATTLAYGHIGFLEGSDEQLMQIYYLLQPLQEHYVMIPVERIAYEFGGRLLPTSDAMAHPEWDQGERRIHVIYENGFRVWVNGGRDDWEIDAGAAGRLHLPPWGFAAFDAAGSVMSSSTHVRPVAADDALARDRLLDLAHGPDSHYFGAPGGFVYAGSMAGDGGVALKREAAGWELIPARSFREVGFAPALIGMEGMDIRIEAIDAAGGVLAEVTPRWSRGLCWVRELPEGCVKARLHAAGERQESGLDSASRVALSGELLTIVWTGPDPAEGVEWEFADGTRTSGSLHRQGNTRTATCEIPADALAGHAWLRCRNGDTDAWLDVFIVSPWDIQVSTPGECRAKEGQPLQIQARVLNRLPTTLDLALGATADAGTVADVPRQLSVPARSGIDTDLAWSVPWAPGRPRLSLDAVAGNRRQSVELVLQTRLEPMLLVDLLDSDITWRKGRRSRDGSGGQGLVTIYDGSAAIEPGATSAGVTRPAFFMHPPWGKCPPGYTYAETTLTLPAGTSSLVGWTGMRDGMDASDGVVFSAFVTTTDDDVTTNVFERHHVQVAWEPLAVDLTPFAGKTAILRLQVDCGPADNTSADHALWGQPRLVSSTNVLVAIPVTP